MSITSSIKCIVVDDEPLARKGVEILIADLPWLEHVKSLENALTATDFLKTNDIDLVFLDIEMPGLNGLDFLKNIRPDCFVILTTAYPQYALDAFELSVVDYLMKPIKFDRFFAAVNKVKDIIDLQLRSKAEISETKEDHFYIKADRKFVKLFYEHITYIKGLKDYVLIYTDDQKYMTAMNVKTIHKQLPNDRFARVSKSYIINTNKMTSIDIDLIYLGDIEIPLGRTYKEDFIQTYIKGKLIKR